MEWKRGAKKKENKCIAISKYKLNNEFDYLVYCFRIFGADGFSKCSNAKTMTFD